MLSPPQAGEESRIEKRMPFSLRKELLGLTIALAVLTLTAGAQSKDESSPSTDTILLTFDGGVVRQSDFNAFVDFKTVFYNNGDRRSPQYLLYNSKQSQEDVLNIIAFNKIARAIVEQNKLDKRDYFTLKVKNNSYQMAWQYFMLTQMYPVIKKARKPWEEKWLNYYEEHKNEYRGPGKVSYRMIFLDTVRVNEEEKQKKYALAEKIRKELEKEPQAFIPLAKEYSEADESARGEVLGPFRLDQINQTLAEAIKKLNVGEISPVVHCSDGTFIFLLEDRKKGDPKPFPEVRRNVVANTGEFYVYDIVKDFKKQLIGDAEPVYLNDNISSATADRDKVIVRLGDAEIRNREVEYLLPILYDARFNNPDDIKILLAEIIEKKAIFESGKRKGFFNSQRFVNYMNTYTEHQYAGHFIRLYQKGELPKEFLNMGDVEELRKKLVSRYNPHLLQCPEIPPIR